MISKMNKFLRLNKGSDERGGLMIEAIAMLGMIAMVTPMLFKKSQERTNDIQDVNIANHMRLIMSGVDDYIRGNYAALVANATITETGCTPAAVNYSTSPQVVDLGHFCNYLPTGYQNLAPAILGEYRVSILNNAGEISAVLATKEDGSLHMIRSAKISSLIGAHGGYVKPSSNTVLSGNQGAWQLTIADYFPAAWKPGESSLAVTSSYTGVTDTSEFLYRSDVPGYPEFNTMMTDLHMGNNDIDGVHKLTVDAGAAATTAIEVTQGGLLLTAGDLTMSAGNVDVTGTIDSTGNITSTATVQGADLVGTNSLNIGGGNFDVNSAGNVDGEGTANFGGLVTAEAGLNVTGDVTATGDVNAVNGVFSGNVGAVDGNFSGNVGVAGTTTTGTLAVTNNATVGGTLDVTGTTTLANTNVNGDLGVTGATTTGTLAVTGDATVGDDLTVTNNIISTNGNIISGGTVEALTDVIADGRLFAQDNGGGYDFEVSDDGSGNNQMFLREGYIEVTATGDTLADKGYIKVPRMITDTNFELPVATLDCSTSPCTVTSSSKADPEGYDKYQVNPAHTSVMKDIKLASRGGARLSEILPDFINKGIFVLDNTYKQYWMNTNTNIVTGNGVNPPAASQASYGKIDVDGNGIKGEAADKLDLDNDGTLDETWLLNWSNNVDKAEDDVCGAAGNQPCKPPINFPKMYESYAEECETDKFLCQTSPWMGFIPSPVCPENYSAIVTMSPVRWRSSRVYSQGIDANTLGDSLEISPDADKQGTFQTNTWTALTVEAYCEDDTGATVSCSAIDTDDVFYGWSGMMGFLYPFDHDGDGVQDQIAWNAWPVNNKELSAIANIYCLFMRRNPGFAGAPRWDADVVDVNYDQLRNFRYAGDYGDKTNTSESTTQTSSTVNIYGTNVSNIIRYDYDGGVNTKGLYDTRIKKPDTSDKHTYDVPWN